MSGTQTFNKSLYSSTQNSINTTRMQVRGSIGPLTLDQPQHAPLAENEVKLNDAESTSLYLKDIKTFLSLKKVADNCTKKKKQKYEESLREHYNS